MWLSFNPILQTHSRFLGFRWREYSLTAGMSLQGRKIPLGLIASIVKTEKISRRDIIIIVIITIIIISIIISVIVIIIIINIIIIIYLWLSC